ncbi:MAG: hypothetical protein K8R63_04725 [Bacteroidales bacterium]|nr:hypothetical protein [Bacteroidales bacterium]
MLEKNFENDIKQEIKRISDDIGIKVKLTDRLDKILLDYLTVRFKLIDLKYRNIKFNPDFLSDLNNHPQKKEIEFISQIAKKGGNLNVFQSKRLLQTGFHDHLISEWNIYHFHLSLKIDKKSKFVKQVDTLLFAYIDDKQIIFLGTDNHTEGIFADTKWIEVLHDHFPKVIEEYKDDTIKEISPKINSEERQMLWNKGYTLGMTKVRDVVYHNPGIGRATSGHSSTVVSTEISIFRWIYKINEQIDDCANELCEYLKVDTENAKFKVKFNDNLEIVELTSGIKILDFPQILIDKEELINK